MNEEQATALCSEVSAAATDVLVDLLRQSGEGMEPGQVTQIIAGCLANQILTMAMNFVHKDALMTKQEVLSAITREVIEKLIGTISAYLENPEKYLIATDEDGQVMDWSDVEGEDE